VGTDTGLYSLREGLRSAGQASYLTVSNQVDPLWKMCARLSGEAGFRIAYNQAKGRIYCSFTQAPARLNNIYYPINATAGITLVYDVLLNTWVVHKLNTIADFSVPSNDENNIVEMVAGRSSTYALIEAAPDSTVLRDAVYIIDDDSLFQDQFLDSVGDTIQRQVSSYILSSAINAYSSGVISSQKMLNLYAYVGAGGTLNISTVPPCRMSLIENFGAVANDYTTPNVENNKSQRVQFLSSSAQDFLQYILYLQVFLTETDVDNGYIPTTLFAMNLVTEQGGINS
jgi:hypothetical protein